MLWGTMKHTCDQRSISDRIWCRQVFELSSLATCQLRYSEPIRQKAGARQFAHLSGIAKPGAIAVQQMTHPESYRTLYDNISVARSWGSGLITIEAWLWNQTTRKKNRWVLSSFILNLPRIQEWFLDWKRIVRTFYSTMTRCVLENWRSRGVSMTWSQVGLSDLSATSYSVSRAWPRTQTFGWSWSDLWDCPLNVSPSPLCLSRFLGKSPHESKLVRIGSNVAPSLKQKIGGP